MEHEHEEQDILITYWAEGDEDLADRARVVVEEALESAMTGLIKLGVMPAIDKTGPGSRATMAKYEAAKAKGTSPLT